MYLNDQEWSLIYIYVYTYYIYVYTYYTYYMHIHSENVKFIVVNLKEDVIKIYFFTLISFRLTMIKFTISGCVCTNTHTHIYIYILVPFFDNLHIIYILIHLNLTRNWAKKDYSRFIKYLF